MAKTKPDVEERPIGWEETIDRFCTYLVEQEKSPNTIRCYLNDLHLFHAWYQSEQQCEPELATIDAGELRTWKASMITLGHAPQTVNRRLATIQSLLRWGQFREWCQAIQSPRTVRQEPPPPRWLTRPEENGLVRAVRSLNAPRDHALVVTLLHAGLRIAEAADAKWDKIDIAPRSGSIAVIGKGRKHREIPLDAEARAALGAWSDHNSGGLGRLGSGRPVFVGQQGPMQPKSLGLVVASHGPRAKLFDLTAHTLRHTCCKRWLESGLGLEQVAKLAGHESMETTRRYVEPGQADLQALVERRCGAEPDAPVEAKPRSGRRRR